MENPAPISSQNGQPSVEPQPGLGQCAVHPDSAATFCCPDCGRTFCDACGLREEDGKIVCSECAAQRKPPEVVVSEPDLGPVDPEIARKMAVKSDFELLD